MAPPLTCLTVSVRDLDTIHGIDGAFDVLYNLLCGDAVLVGHNIAYDMAVLCAEYPDLVPLIFDAYRADRITCTKIRQQIIDIAAGTFRGRLGDGNVWVKYGYALDDLTRRFLNRQLKKDGFRMSYGELRNVPLAEWVDYARNVMQPAALLSLQGPLSDEERKIAEDVAKADPAEIIKYPLADSRATLEIAELQEADAEYLKDQYRQAYAAFCLQLSSVWGISTDPEKVEAFAREVAVDHEIVKVRLQNAGIVRADGSRDMKKAKQAMIDACAREGQPVRLTEKGNVCLDSDACDAVDDPIIEDYAAYSTLAKVTSTDVPMLRKGLIHTSYGLAASGRTTSSGPNIQNLRRKEGIREAFTPRPGYVFAQADYAALELHTLAQVCMELFGHSKLAEALNAGRDPHSEMAARILGISYEDVLENKKDPEVDNARQTSKVANFGIPGGLGAEKLVLFARKTYDVTLTVTEAYELKGTFFETWTEMAEYFAYVSEVVENEGGIAQLYVDRYRGGCTYTAACNTLFQGLGADCAKSAACLIAYAQYVDTESPMYGTRTAAFVHDEFIVETPISRGPEVAEELSRLMIKGASKYLTMVKPKAEPCLMSCWSKKAETLRDESGRLMIWSP